ncbi:bifunctional hydroxymethylpyrimidine kinase/phosphomethylpyrimidine kinase [Legionella oakridgensis]|uniref:hydroxymethylpyrimidine kinase n=2 Tax=Legionella oakridgensis TaxID=29423 RepID=W0BB01_9GAMM|nr:bifunctional hydroxymethylpyrimidine kinase/phosphomethylpyrimidine kinase [Legionella oakridgensis]AHE67035.1 phosphomethylpyrimidine kinase [Legionella oakridgensis ATCC 33761 = DSM 21215]ETO93321.1 hydroxymethylpyrimidine kinase/phosphomethylpyrimidine kinase [Legionella oakridgensis RV-2-2007]KTD37186.1 bifunctional hydroxy-methylpyrimidine kinase and hydroxy-phosphomethylpyrimidine kinase [Legionella oakridgensis]STY20130.1 bifunctional hydroxy-methylpyrimidine kinase and hydroxy-phosph
MNKKNHPCVLTIAGTDPSGGAGIQADIKAISATGSYAASVITALVAQNTQGVQAILDVPASFIRQQLDSVCQDLNIISVKIGMLYNIDVIDVVTQSLQVYKPKHVVLDPVMVAKNGSPLLKIETLAYLKDRLFPNVHLLTPNLFEAEKILNAAITTREDMADAAKTMAEAYGVNVLLKGGHLNSLQASDVLYSIKTRTMTWFHAKRIVTKNTHGTGCSLSAAIASFLAQEEPLETAIGFAKHYLANALASGSHRHIGHGHGPIDHFYFLEDLRAHLATHAACR